MLTFRRALVDSRLLGVRQNVPDILFILHHLLRFRALLVGAALRRHKAKFRRKPPDGKKPRVPVKSYSRMVRSRKTSRFRHRAPKPSCLWVTLLLPRKVLKLERALQSLQCTMPGISRLFRFVKLLSSCGMAPAKKSVTIKPYSTEVAKASGLSAFQISINAAK